MSRNYILETWYLYRQISIPKDCPSDVLEKLKDVFFVGAAALFDTIMDLTPGDDVEDADLVKMNCIHKELESHVEAIRLKLGVPKIGRT